MPKGFYFRSEKYREDMKIKMLEVMNRPDVREKQRKGALRRWKNYREKPKEIIEPKEKAKEIINLKNEKALEIAKEFVGAEISDPGFAKLVVRAIERQNKQEAEVEVVEDFSQLSMEELEKKATNLEGEFSLCGLYDICKKVFLLSLHAERTKGLREKYITMLSELGKHRKELEEAKRKRGR